MTVCAEPLPDRSLLLRTLVPIVGPLSPDAVVCDLTAAYLWGVDLYPAGTRATRVRAHVALPRGVRTSGVPVIAHRSPMPAADRTVVEGLRLTTPERTAADVAARAPSVFTATARLDAFLSRDLVTRADLVRAAHRSPPGRRLRQLRTALRYSCGLSQSPAESWTRVLVLEALLPPPVAQCPVRTDRGLFRADLGWPDQRVALEYDSLLFHSSPRARARDRDRYAAMRSRDWEVVTVSVYDLQCRPHRLLRRILDTLLRRGWSCPPERLARIRGRLRSYEKDPPRLLDPGRI
ncbi:type IV toxin-antitoxin system AbiEi family antitoxin [Nocardiopsis sp. FR4]|uniref:type IV toxin-antitoxin system AbiEi family antitoxin n=1 Tax=Nocardiopsis sp. FR4 TaxID=2605985 RepID=UPI00135A3CD1|nr:type IV toxin-antitoxin system AbiEi family antitoxin [Nocardiopsis sp. FR4]